MVEIGFTISGTCEVDEEILKEYENGALEFIIDGVSLDIVNSQYLEYEVEEAMEF